MPTGVGRLCNWTPNLNGPSADTYPSFGAYQRSLTLKCDEGEPGIITWTPDRNTPDTVYYQCFSHRYLGWKINVLDHCESGQESEIDEVFVDPEDAVVAEPSINHESKILPSENFLQKHEKDLIKHHNMNGTPPKVSVDFQKNSEIHKLITEGIRTAEALEESILNGTRYSPHPHPNENSPQRHRGPEKHDDDDDSIEAIAKLPQNIVKSSPGRPASFPGLPSFLRPPQSPNIYPYRPANLPVRRPITIERRPMGRPQRPYLLPQSTMVINQFKKPSANFGVRNFMKPKLHKPHASVLMLGEPTEIKPFKKLAENMHQKPYMIETAPMMKFKKTGVEPMNIPRPSKYAAKKDKNIPRNSFKDPFEIRNESVQLQEVKNTGFKPDSVVVESGFKPISRRDENIQPTGSVEDVRISERRRDDFISDIDEAIEGDALLIQNDEPRRTWFEPMFIPSPLDSVALPQRNASNAMVYEDGEDKFAEANERQDYFYLPPESKKLLAFDGSLLHSDPTKINRNDYAGLSSKTQQFIKETPQFGPFRGEIPKDLILQLSANRAEDPISEYTDPSTLKDKNPISTKLSVVKSDDSKSSRTR